MRSLRLWSWLLIFALAGHASLDAYRWLVLWMLAAQGGSMRRAGPFPGWGWTILVATAICVGLWCLWQSAAAANVRDRVRHHLRFGRDVRTLRHDRPEPLRFGPAAILWWFVPIFQLRMPYLAVAEIRDRSCALAARETSGRGVLLVWWLLLLSLPFDVVLGALLSFFTGWDSYSDRVSYWRAFTTLTTARDLVLAAFAAAVVWRINALQEAWPRVDLDELGTRGRAPGGL